MNIIIKILREQMILCKRLNEIFEQLQNSLKENTAGQGVTSSVQTIEPLMMDLSKIETKIKEFLKETGYTNIKTFIESQPAGIEHDVALRLLSQVSQLQEKLRHRVVNSSQLLVKSKTFIDYNLNVMSQTVANNTYGLPGKELQNQRRRRIFETNV